MPYYVQRSGKSWQLTFRKGSNRSRNVSKTSSEASGLGFRRDMSFEDARALAKSLQNVEWLTRRHKAYERTEHQEKLRGAFLTDQDAEEFEQKYLKEYKITQAWWKIVQQLILDIGIHPSEWFDRKSLVYGAFKSRKYAPNTAKKILRYLNIWGYFICKKYNRAWFKVPGLDGSWKNQLELTRKTSGASKPLSPELLESKKNSIPESAFKWLYISVWFGLRPREIDNLTKVNDKLWYIQDDVLCIFQEKLFERGVPQDDCWKYIPVEFPEQRQALEYIKEGNFKKPIGACGRFMEITFGKGFSYYAGRNNFSGLLRDRGYDLEARKHWLGHLSIKTTEAYDRKTMKSKVFRPVKKSS